MRFVLITAICLSFILPAEAEAQPRVDSPIPVKFATSTITPWGIVEPGRAPSGLLVSVMQALHRETGIAVNNQMMPYPRAIHSLYTGAVDLAILFDSPSARQSAIHVGHVVDSRILIIGIAGSEPVSSVAQLAGKKVGHLSGSSYGPEFDDEPSIQHMPVKNMFKAMAMLLHQRLDAMAGTDQAIYWTMEKMQLDPARIQVLLDFKGASGSLYMSKQSLRQDLLPVYRQALLKLKRNGVLTEIFDREYSWSRQQGRILPDPASP